jgi:CheY-like chemotaxis protein
VQPYRIEYFFELAKIIFVFIEFKRVLDNYASVFYGFNSNRSKNCSLIHITNSQSNYLQQHNVKSTWTIIGFEGFELIINTLIVDDDQEVRNTLASILENESYLVETAENGKKAIRMCEKTSFDLALIDIELPDIKGTELLHILYEMQPKMVRIIITGYPTIENAAKSVNEKADGYVMKPFVVPELLAMIKKLIEDKQNAYFKMFTDVEQAKQATPVFRYQHPTKW